MPIRYVMVAEGNEVLGEEPTSAKDHAQTARQVLSKLEKKNQKRTLTNGGVNVHLKYASGFLIICIADSDFPLRVCYAFIEDIEKTVQVNPRGIKSVLRQKMQHYNDPRADDISRVRDEISEVRGVMLDNIDKVLERQDRLDLIVDKTDQLKQQATTFRSRTGQLKRHFCLQHAKLMIILTLVILVVLFFIIVGACGGFSFPRCGGS